MEAAQIPRQLADVDFGVINSNYALQAGVEVTGTALATESPEVAYPNVIAIREGDDREELKTLVEVLQSDEMVEWINETYQGAGGPDQIKGRQTERKNTYPAPRFSVSTGVAACFACRARKRPGEEGPLRGGGRVFQRCPPGKGEFLKRCKISLTWIRNGVIL